MSTETTDSSSLFQAARNSSTRFRSHSSFAAGRHRRAFADTFKERSLR